MSPQLGTCIHKVLRSSPDLLQFLLHFIRSASPLLSAVDPTYSLTVAYFRRSLGVLHLEVYAVV
jgi:hypothetical protein